MIYSFSYSLDSLDRGELEKMFNKYNFNISKKDLKPLFKIVDDDKNGFNFNVTDNNFIF